MTSARPATRLAGRPARRRAAGLLALLGGLAAATALAAGPTPAPTPVRTVPVVVQDADGHGAPSPERVAAAVRTAQRLAPGATPVVLRAFGPGDAQALVARAVTGGQAVVVGAGPDVRAALAVARQVAPELRTATVPAR